jgi:hypothetical protein
MHNNKVASSSPGAKVALVCQLWRCRHIPTTSYFAVATAGPHLAAGGVAGRTGHLAAWLGVIAIWAVIRLLTRRAQVSVAACGLQSTNVVTRSRHKFCA